MTGTPQGAGLYLAVVQLLFTLGWTVYAIFLPQLADQAGIPRPFVIWILLADQVVFAVMDYAMGVAADRVSQVIGKLGRLMVILTAVSCAAFVALPFVTGAGAPALLVLIAVWAVTSSALRAPPLMLLGKYAAVPSVPWLASLALLGIGIAGAVAPYLTVALRGADPRVPFALSGATLLLAVFGLVAVERKLAAGAMQPSGRPAAPRAAIPPTERSSVFLLAMALLGLGFQVHSAMNSVPQFLRFAKPTDLDMLLPVFWIGFNVAMFPASVLTNRWGGLMVMGLAGVIGGVATHVGAEAESLSVLVTAQAIAGAAWGAVLMSAVSAALTIGRGGAEGRLVGAMWSALALATVMRMGLVAGGVPGDPAYKPLLPFVPTVAWLVAGAALLVLYIVAGQRRPATA